MGKTRKKFFVQSECQLHLATHSNGSEYNIVLLIKELGLMKNS